LSAALDETQKILIDALGGDPRSRNDLLERLRPRIVLWVAARLSEKLRSLVEPDDVAQDILLAVHRALDQYRGQTPRAFYAWLFQIAENRIRDLADHHGALKRQPTHIIVPSQTTPGTRVVRSEQTRIVRRAVEHLTESHRLVIQLLRLEERDVSEVAELMERSDNAVRVLYCRALKSLREAMAENE